MDALVHLRVYFDQVLGMIVQLVAVQVMDLETATKRAKLLLGNTAVRWHPSTRDWIGKLLVRALIL